MTGEEAAPPRRAFVRRRLAMWALAVLCAAAPDHGRFAAWAQVEAAGPADPDALAGSATPDEGAGAAASLADPATGAALAAVGPTLFADAIEETTVGAVLAGVAETLYVAAIPAGGSATGPPVLEMAPLEMPRVDGPAPAVPGWLLTFHATMVARGVPMARPVPRGEVLDREDVLPRVDHLAAADPRGFTVATTAIDTPSTDLRMLLARGEQWHVLSLGAVARSRGLDATLNTYGQVAYLPDVAPRTVAAAVGPEPEDRVDPASVGVKAEVEGLELGAEYRSLGRRLERVVRVPQARRDREGGEMWVSRRFGVLRLRVSQSDLSDNVDRDPALPRTTRAQTAALAEVSPSGWPVLGLSYATGDSERVWLTPGARARGTDRQAFDSVAATAYYDGAGWQASAASTYVTSSDRADRERETTALYQDVGLTLRLAAALAVTGTVTVGREEDDRSDARSDMHSAFVTLSYDPPGRRWHAWTLAGHSGRRSTDGSVDGQTVSVGAGLGCDLGKVFSGRARLSVEAGYDQYLDRVTPSGSSQSLHGFVRLTLPAF